MSQPLFRQSESDDYTDVSDDDDSMGQSSYVPPDGLDGSIFSESRNIKLETTEKPPKLAKVLTFVGDPEEFNELRTNHQPHNVKPRKQPPLEKTNYFGHLWVKWRRLPPRSRICRISFFFFLFAVITISTIYISGNLSLFWPTDPDLRARVIMTKYPFVDSSNFLPFQYRHVFSDQVEGTFAPDLRMYYPFWRTDMPRLKTGLVGVVIWNAFVPCIKQYRDALKAGLEQIDVIKRFAEKYEDTVTLTHSIGTAKALFSKQKIASFISVHGAHMIDDSLATIRIFRELKVKMIVLIPKIGKCSPVWAGSIDGPDTPLSSFGIDVVKEMNRLGMVIGLSRASNQTINNVFEQSVAPVVFDDSCILSIFNYSTCVTDEQLFKLKENGGLIMVGFDACGYDDCPEMSLEIIVQEIMYAGNLIGYDHIGIASGFDGGYSVLDKVVDTSEFPNLVAELFRQGLSDEKVVKIMGSNIERVFSDVEAIEKSQKGSTIAAGWMNRDGWSKDKNKCWTGYYKI